MALQTLGVLPTKGLAGGKSVQIEAVPPLAQPCTTVPLDEEELLEELLLEDELDDEDELLLEELELLPEGLAPPQPINWPIVPAAANPPMDFMSFRRSTCPPTFFSFMLAPVM